MTDKRYQVGIWVTAIYVAALSVYSLVERTAILAMKPNEFGDALAGAASPLAFLWLVLGYLQQGEELKQNTKALLLQADQLKNSVEQQAKMVETSKEQLKTERERHAEANERAAKALLPGFVMDVEKTDRNGENKLYRIKVRNVGAKCTGLIATFVWGDQIYQSQEVGVFEPFGEFAIDIAWPVFAVEPRQCIFMLNYYILQGGLKSTSIPIEFYWSGQGLMFLRELEPVDVHGPSPLQPLHVSRA